MTTSAIAQICNAHIIGFLAGLVVLLVLICIVQQIIIHTKGIKLEKQ